MAGADVPCEGGYVRSEDAARVQSLHTVKQCVRCRAHYMERDNFRFDCPRGMHASVWSVDLRAWTCCGQDTLDAVGCVDSSHTLLPSQWWQETPDVRAPWVPTHLLAEFGGHEGNIDSRCWDPDYETVRALLETNPPEQVRLWRYDRWAYATRSNQARYSLVPAMSIPDVDVRGLETVGAPRAACAANDTPAHRMLHYRARQYWQSARACSATEGISAPTLPGYAHM